MKQKSSAVSCLSLLLLAIGGVAVWAAPLFAPEPGLLVLKNGRVISGGILREGDKYIVTVGSDQSSGELKIPASEVLFACRDLVEAYERKRDMIRGIDTKPHLDLAEWCIAQGLYDRAADQLVAAMKLDPYERRTAELERRLKLAAKPQAAKPLPVYQLPPSPSDIAATIRALPPETVEQFAANVQPLLLNRCAATSCHGPSARSDYHLIRPPAKHVNTTRETQRNLFSTLARVNLEGESPLLTVPLAPHGGQKTAVLTQHDRRQIEQLAAWIETIKRQGASTASSNSSTTTEGVRQADYTEPAKSTTNKPVRLPSIEPGALPVNRNVRAMPIPGNSGEKKKKPADIEAAEFARDPFDASVFNQRYHADEADKK